MFLSFCFVFQFHPIPVAVALNGIKKKMMEWVCKITLNLFASFRHETHYSYKGLHTHKLLSTVNNTPSAN